MTSKTSMIVHRVIKTKLSKSHQKIMYLIGVLEPPFWILIFSILIHNQHPQKPPSKSFQNDLSTFRALFWGWKIEQFSHKFWLFSLIFLLQKYVQNLMPQLKVLVSSFYFRDRQVSLSDFAQELEKKMLRRVYSSEITQGV